MRQTTSQKNIMKMKVFKKSTGKADYPFWIGRMTVQDSLHYKKSDIDILEKQYSERERKSRLLGIPEMGSGKIFSCELSQILCDPFPIPPHWLQVAGIDFGWDHPTAAICAAYDKDSHKFYVTRSYKKRHATPSEHAQHLKTWGKQLPFAWPQDGLQHSKESGRPLVHYYRSLGMNFLKKPAAFEDGSRGVEAALHLINEEMMSQRFFVFRGLVEWNEEFELYHRNNGAIHKIKDDLMDATRYAWLMKRFAKSTNFLTRNEKIYHDKTDNQWLKII